MNEQADSWTELDPKFEAAPRSNGLFLALAGEALALQRSDDLTVDLPLFRESLSQRFRRHEWPRADRQALLTLGSLLADLAVQGWGLRVRSGTVQTCAPQADDSSALAEKERLRQGELMRRDAQLRQPAVRRFIRSMEKRRLHEGKFVSVFSLMRDGRDFAAALSALSASGAARLKELDGLIAPYLQFFDEDSRCPHTGLRLMSVWRYFRHTWTNPYTSVPGRSMMFLVRDAASINHPVMGIGALSSPVVQLRERDTWIGWHPDVVIDRLRKKPRAAEARWLLRIVDDAIEELYVSDFVEDGLLSPAELRRPKPKTLVRLLETSVTERDAHHRYVRAKDLKRGPAEGETPDEFWVRRARTHLFRSKRALALADLLEARATLDEAFDGAPCAKGLTKLVGTNEGARVVRKIVKRAKADRVGVSVADVTVCGAVQPYNALLGGKLVAAMAVSPTMVAEYRRRYGAAVSEIASAMAGRPIVRSPELAIVTTTSLYGTGSSQYNRIKIPCGQVGGPEGEAIAYQRLGHSEAFGTAHLSDETLDALQDLVEQHQGGARVNSIFGEGVSPKLRKVREGLDTLGLPSVLLLKHHRRRIAYGVRLVTNPRDYLLGLTRRPRYLLDPDQHEETTKAIVQWWKERWLSRRVLRDDVLEEVCRHRLIHPIRHGARVPPQVENPAQRNLFPDL